MYIGIGTVVLISAVIIIVMLLRGRTRLLDGRTPRRHP